MLFETLEQLGPEDVLVLDRGLRSHERFDFNSQ